MKDYTNNSQESLQDFEVKSALEEALRIGARRMLQTAVFNETEEFIKKHKDLKDENGKKIVVRNGSLPERDIITGIGPIKIKRPRIDDRQLPDSERFASMILPKYLRRTKRVDTLIPYLYLKGISTGNFNNAMSSLLGENAVGLSPTNIVKLKKVWEDEYEKWSTRDLSDKNYVFFWVDGIHFNVRLDDDKSCILVIIGADEGGNKELVAVCDGYRESKASWKEILTDLKFKQNLVIEPKLAIGDGALGFWAAVGESYPATKGQRCWVHKTANILDKVPRRVRSKMKSDIHDMYLAENKKSAISAMDLFVKKYEAKYPRATECLTKDKDMLFSFYDFPAEQWQHIRTTNPIESTFATVRNRTKTTKGCGSRLATLTMVFKLVQEAQKRWMRLRGYKQIPLLVEGRTFVDGELKEVA